MTSQYRDVLFFVFTGFFILIGLASLSVLLGFPKTADKRFRQWAIPGFFAGVTTAVFGLFRILITEMAPMAPIAVTLFPPAGMSVFLKGGAFEYIVYDVSAAVPDQVTRRGSLSPVPAIAGDGWEVYLPSEASARPTTLHLEDMNGGWWDAGPFFPNRVTQGMRTGKPFVPVSDPTWQPPGVALVSAAEPGRAPASQEQAGTKFNNYARKIADRYERPHYEWRVFVDEPPAVLARIVQVDYVLHPTFPDPFQTSRDRSSKFALTASGWGGFNIVITVHYTDGREAKTSYFLDLQKSWPAEAQRPAASSMRLELEKIRVDWDGSPGSAGWMFDILLDGKPLLRLPNRSYNDDTGGTKKANEYVPDANRRVVGPVKVARGQAVRIDVQGKRTSGNDTATGTASLSASGGPITVNVANKGDPKRGSFVFYFAAVPM